MPETPTYSLQDVHRLVEAEINRDPGSNAGDTVWFSARSKSYEAVIEAFSDEEGGPKNVDEAKVFILEGIKQLTDRNFLRRNIQWDDPSCIADNYGLIYAKKHWFVKFLIEDDCLEEISFHPPERDDVTVGGIEIRKEQHDENA